MTKPLSQKSGIYRILNTVNGNQYVGSSKDINIRKGNHFRSLRAGKHGNEHLQRAFNKYGEKAFLFEVLCECSEKYLIKKEQIYIDKTATDIGWAKLYNICPRADRSFFSDSHKGKISIALSGKNNPMYGRQHPDSVKQKISESLRGKMAGEKNPMYGKYGKKNPMYGRRHTQKAKDKISKANKGKSSPFKGKRHTEETKKKISESNKGENSVWFGRKHMQETKNKIANANKGKIVSGETKKKMSIAAKKRTGKKNSFYGKNHTEESKQKMSKSHKKNKGKEV